MTSERPVATRIPSTPRRARFAPLALALGACAIGVSELAAIGVLDLVSDDLGADVGATGHIVTAYAVGVCLGGPVLAMVTAGRDRRSIMIRALAAFILCNGIIAVAPALAGILVLRLIAGSIHGLYIGLATSHAAALASPERRGSAIALVFGGIAVATVIGAPLGKVVAEVIGWRAAFWSVAVVAAVALLAVLRSVPGVEKPPGGVSSSGLRAALTPRVLAFLALIVLTMGGVFAFYTYVTSFLEVRTGLAGPAAGVLLLAFGVASAVGTILGGRLADRAAATTMVWASGSTVIALIALATVGSSVTVTALALVVCGLAAFAFVPASSCGSSVSPVRRPTSPLRLAPQPRTPASR